MAWRPDGSSPRRGRGLALLAAALLGGLVGFASPAAVLADGPYDPPDVEGYPIEVALKELSAWSDQWWPDQKPGIEVGDWPNFVDIATVFVLHETVNAYDDVAPPDIQLAVGVQVPSFIDLSLDVAREEAASRDLELIARDTNAAGDWAVVDQFPLAGEVVDFGTGVEVAVRPANQGPFDPPNVEGLQLEAARKELSVWSDQWWSDQPPLIDEGGWPDYVDIAYAFVLHQEVNGLDDASPPDIVLGVGVQVPNLVDLSLDVAREEAAAHDLELVAGDPDAGGDWTVVEQNPNPGDLVEFGSGVEVAVQPAAASPVPSVAPSSSSTVAPPPTPETPPPSVAPSVGPTTVPTADEGPSFGLVVLVAVLIVAVVGTARWLRRPTPRPPTPRPQPWGVRITAKGRPDRAPDVRIEELEP